jgi:hypothetical protein
MRPRVWLLAGACLLVYAAALGYVLSATVTAVAR